MEELRAFSDTAQKLSTSFISREAGGGVSALQCVCDRVKGTGEGKHNEKARGDTVLINEEAETERGMSEEKQKQEGTPGIGKGRE